MMDHAQHTAAVQDRRPSPHLTLELSSNNPFRNRAASPAVASPALDTPGSIRSQSSNRPVSRNPFLANFEQDLSPGTQAHPKPPFFDTMASSQKATVNKAEFGSHVDELFHNLSLNGSNERRDSESKVRLPPPRAGTLPPPNHRRPSRSNEEETRRENRTPRPRAPPGERRPVDSPERRENRRPVRRNSESSIIDKGSLDADEERKRRERRKERERQRDRERNRDGKPREGRSGQKPKKPHGLDTIDKLDLTGLYGSGLFHHDGPFDACNPHRNRKKDHRAPMQAFPADSANNALGGSGPLNQKIDLDRIHGRGAEGFTDYNASTTGMDPFDFRAKRPQDQRFAAYNSKSAVEPVHGEETVGLGTSTFLEGAPASRTAIQRRESEHETSALQASGLTRKKSLAQRIRGMSNTRRQFGEGAPRIGSGEPRYGNGTSTPGEGQSGHMATQSAGGMSKTNELNPFFDDYDEAYERKGTTIKIAEDSKPSRPPPAVPSSPKRGLERRVTSDSAEERESKPSGGFINRMKSLKGGKRPRPERPMA